MPEITDKHSSHGAKQPLDADECRALLKKFTQRVPRTTFITNALDECQNAEVLLQYLEDFQDPDGKIKFLFSSRLQVDVKECFPSSTEIQLGHESQRHLTAPDMQHYIRTQVKRRREMCMGKQLLDGDYPDLEERLIKILT